MTTPPSSPTPGRLQLVLGPAFAWLLDAPAASATTRRVLSAVTFATFVGLVVLGAAAHDVWRDEARALTIALEPDSWLGLRTALRNEGHPALWHLVLRGAHALAGTPMVLPVVTAAIGVGGAALAFFAAPLPTWWRVGFLFGWVPMFEASILRRNYGISMLLAFAFCLLATRARPRPLLAATTLALLANTNVYGTMMAGCLGLVLAAQTWRRARGAMVAAVVAVVALGIAASVWTLLPTAESKLLPSTASTLDDLGSSIVRGFTQFDTSIGPLFGLTALAWPIVLLTAAATLCVPHVAVAVLAFFAGAGWFITRVYSAGPHHLGMLFVFLVAATWLRAAAGERACAGGRAAGLHRLAWSLLLFGVWPALLMLHGYRGFRALKDEVDHVNTCAPELAQLLARPELRDAIVIGEPDYFLDALPWYRDNPIFVWREGRFARRVSWTIANRRDGDLDLLLGAARALQREQHVPVVLVIGQPIALAEPQGDVVHGYADRFRWTPQQQRAFVDATEHLASLPARPSRFRGDERYEVYRLRD